VDPVEIERRNAIHNPTDGSFVGEDSNLIHNPADELDAGEQRLGKGELDSSLCEGVNDFIESEKDGVLVPEGRKNKGFAFARFLMDRAGRALRVVVATEARAVHRGCVAELAVLE